jgi:F-type H+-transporting ATPase subunit delta
MPEYDEESLALASVYADALLEAAGERGEAEQVADELGDLVAYMDRDMSFDAFLRSAAVDDDPRRESLERLFRGRMNDVLLNCLQVMNNRWRLGLVRALQRCVQLRMEAKHNEQEVTVETAVPLTDRLRDDIKALIGSYIGKTVLLIEKVEPDLIGGMVLYINDIQIDASLTSAMKTLRQRLTDRATEEIHSGRGFEGELEQS